MPLLPARAVSAAPTASARRRGENGSSLQVRPAASALTASTIRRGERGQVFGAALDRVRPFALARAEIGGRQQLGQRDDAGQRRADVVHDAGERGLDRAGLIARLHDAASREAACAAVSDSYASPSPTPSGRPCHGSRAQSSPTALRTSAGRRRLARAVRASRWRASISTACGHRHRGSGGGGGSAAAGTRAAPAAGGGRVAWNRSRPRTTSVTPCAASSTATAR